jgi:hypothetical protein
MENSQSHKPFNRDDIYINENKIKENLGECYNPVINHRQKERDTYKNISPASGLWSSNQIYKTTNQLSSVPKEAHVTCDKLHFMKKDVFKTYYEEMSKTIKLLGKGKIKGGENKSK